jgi:uncharacterized membrane protein
MGQYTHITTYILFLLLVITPIVHGVDYSPNELLLTVYSDGYVDVSYGVSVDSSIPRVNIPLFGSTFEEIIIINQEETPLDYVLNGTSLVVETIGSNNILISYSTLSLTSKVGSLWSLDINSLVNVGILLPVASTIYGTNPIFIELSTVNNRPYILMPPGSSEVNYILGIVGTKEHALAVIKEAQTIIQGIKLKGIIVTSAETILGQAQTAYNLGVYTQAEQYASQAKNEAINTENQANNASTSITGANLAIQNAEVDGRTSNIVLAKNSLQKANEKYGLGEYQNALNYATQATDLANSSRTENNFILIFWGLALIIVVGGVLFFRHKSVEKPNDITKKTEDLEIDVDNIFTKNSELRLDDKEVIRFIADSGGEVFANEIRDRFDIPRTSAWRMIRRLISLGIVEEKKIGGQSLIKITEKYRKQKKPKTEN